MDCFSDKQNAQLKQYPFFPQEGRPGIPARRRLDMAGANAIKPIAILFIQKKVWLAPCFKSLKIRYAGYGSR